MLTRHLYRYDEVRAALLWCLVHRRITEGLFWAQELLDSGCHTELFQILFEGWLWSVGISRFEWLRQFWILLEKPDIDEEELLATTNLLLRLGTRDSTTLHLLLQGPGYVREKLPPSPKTDAFLPLIATVAQTPLQQSLVRCFRLGKVQCAWSLGIQLSNETNTNTNTDSFWSFLSQYELVSHGSPIARQCFEAMTSICTSLFPEDESILLACRATAIGFLCLSPSYQTKSVSVLDPIPIDSHSASLLNEWSTLLGRRGRRCYTPPPDCLSYLTSRGSNPYTKTTIKEIRSLSLTMLREKGCPFWQEALDTTNPWSDDDALESFWDTYFPDDIPDEWSLSDQKKSHDYGVLRPNELHSLGKLTQKWFLRIPSLLLWSPGTQLKSLDTLKQWSHTKVWTDMNEVYQTTQWTEELPRGAKVKRFHILP